MLDEQRRHHMIAAFVRTHGEETAMSLAESLFSVDHATKADLERFATKTDLEAFATKTDLERFATKADLERFATKTDLEAFATKADLERFATKTDLEAFATKTDLVALEDRLGRTIAEAINRQLWWFIGTLVALMACAAALANAVS